MSTVYASIGNSDDKLAQAEWAEFHAEFARAVHRAAARVYGDWVSPCASPYQNACMGFEVDPAAVPDLQRDLRTLATRFRQDSIAWVDGETTFLTACPRCRGRGYVPDWAGGLNAQYGEPGKKACPDCRGEPA